jgi:hypothetical protein
LKAGTDPYGYATNIFGFTDPLGLSEKPCWPMKDALRYALDFYDRQPLLKRLTMIHRGELGPTDRVMEHFAEILRCREGMNIFTHTDEAYRALFNRGRENAGKIVGNDLHFIEDVFAGPEGLPELAHEYAAHKLFQEFSGRHNTPNVAGMPMSLTHVVDEVVQDPEEMARIYNALGD